MDGKIDIHCPQGVPDTIQFLIDQHDPTADHHGTVEKSCTAYRAKEPMDT
jgi:hypothetical protein